MEGLEHHLLFVEKGSTAETEGVNNGDALVCINAKNVENLSHDECAQKIKYEYSAILLVQQASIISGMCLRIRNEPNSRGYGNTVG